MFVTAVLDVNGLRPENRVWTVLIFEISCRIIMIIVVGGVVPNKSFNIPPCNYIYWENSLFYHIRKLFGFFSRAILLGVSHIVNFFDGNKKIGKPVCPLTLLLTSIRILLFNSLCNDVIQICTFCQIILALSFWGMNLFSLLLIEILFLFVNFIYPLFVYNIVFLYYSSW